MDDVEFALIGSGPGASEARVTWKWSSIAYDFDTVFASELKKGTMFPYDPMLLCFKKELNARNNVTSVPEGYIDIPLPIPVQTASNTITKWGKKTTEVES